MAEYITKIRTSTGDKQIDYNALANKPTAESLGCALEVHTHNASDVISSDGNTLETLSTNVSNIESRVSNIEANNKLIVENHSGNNQGYKLLFREVNPLEIGPYYEDSANFVCEGPVYVYSHYGRLNKLTDKDIYKYLTGGYGPAFGYPFDMYAYNEFLYGRYSYSFIESKAYKLDHATKVASLIVDLSSYCAKDGDRIIAIDNQYIYYAKHIARNADGEYDPCYGTIYKFDHKGNIIDSYSESTDSNGKSYAWIFDTHEGFTGSSREISCFSASNERRTIQTKDYIIISTRSGVSGEGGTGIFYKTIISKNTLKVIERQEKIGPSCDYIYILPIYDENIVLSLQTTGVAESPDYNSPAVYIQSISEEGINLLYSSYGPYVSFGGERYQVGSFEVLINHAISHKTYVKLLLMYGDSDSYQKFYTIVSADNFNFNNENPNDLDNFLSIPYVTSDIIPFGNTHYDPVANVFHDKGILFDVYPTYVPLGNVEYTENTNYETVPYTRTDGYFYMLRKFDNKIYKIKDDTYYEINRVVGV